MDASYNVYVADYNNHRIQRFSSEGAFLIKWGSLGTDNGQFSFPFDVAVDASGNVYVADTNNHRIQKFTSTGTFITKWGSYGTGDGEFILPVGVTVDSMGYVYVADANNHRIQKFTTNGTFITKWGSYGTGDGLFNYPIGVAVDITGNVFVTDSENCRIQKFTSEGLFVTQWGSYGTGDGQFNDQQGVTVDVDGNNVYVADTYNNRIQKFQPTSIPAPVAAFSGTPTSGVAPLTVQFTNQSTGTITSYVWDFGDGGTSSQASPMHTYNATGAYTVKLTVITGTGGSDDEIKTDYIVVDPPACSVWDCVYNLLFDNQADLPLMRQYRDQILAKSKAGQLFTKILYDDSAGALRVLLDNSVLMAQAKNLIVANKGAVAAVLNGKKGTIRAADAIAFLDAFGAKSSPALKTLADMVKDEMLARQKKGEQFLGVTLR